MKEFMMGYLSWMLLRAGGVAAIIVLGVLVIF